MIIGLFINDVQHLRERVLEFSDTSMQKNFLNENFATKRERAIFVGDHF